MRHASAVLAFAFLLAPAVANAGNSDDVVAGSDVALTSGAVVANVHTGGAMWFNPAGVARLDSSSVDLTGAVLSYAIADAPGSLSIETGEKSKGEYSAVQAIPRALTFVTAPKPTLRWGIGFFFSRSSSRYVQDTVATDPASTEPSEFYASADETKSLYHLSGTLAWKKSDKFLLGGGLDIVIASRRLTGLVSGAYASGLGGAFNTNSNQAVSGGGLQMKLGIQWAPIEQLRIGWMVATPSYLVYLNNETTETRSVSTPGGPTMFEGSQIDDLSGAWAGVEAGLTRLGAAYMGRWGWIEGDLIVSFPLHTDVLDIHRNATANLRVGTVFRVTDRLKLGAGFFTDFSPEDSPDEFFDTQLDFFGFTVGMDFANREKPPTKDEDGFYLAFAVALRYSHGTGKLAGVAFPSSFPDPPAVPGQLNLVDMKINEFGINLAVKAAF